MPVGPARHIEFAIRHMEEKPDIRLHHLALTHEQVRARDLPRIPIKDSDNRKENFERKHGAGATELNAMMSETRIEDFEEILRSTVVSLRDDELPEKLRQARFDAHEILRREVERRLHWPYRALELLEEQAREIAGRYTEELEDIAERLAAEIAPVEERYEGVRRATRRKLEGVEETELPTVEGVEDPIATDGWLFDSRRDYFHQLGRYKNR